MKPTVPYEQRCPTNFERRTRGRRYVNSRWQCPRKKLKGLPYCSYCEGYQRKRERLTAKAEGKVK